MKDSINDASSQVLSLNNFTSRSQCRVDTRFKLATLFALDSRYDSSPCLEDRDIPCQSCVLNFSLNQPIIAKAILFYGAPIMTLGKQEIFYSSKWLWPLLLATLLSCSANDTQYSGVQTRLKTSSPISTPISTSIPHSLPASEVTIPSINETPTTIPTVVVTSDTNTAVPTVTASVIPTPAPTVTATVIPSPTPTVTATEIPIPISTPAPVMGKNSTYIGFGSATGWLTNEHWIYDFSWKSKFNNISFNDFLSSLTLVKNATLIFNKLRLTESELWQSGNVYLNYPVFVIDSNDQTIDWSASFVFSMGGGTRGDGISFIMQSQASDAGASGVGIGYQGISKSIAVAFDTVKNNLDDAGKPVNDPNNNHIEININGNVNSLVTYIPPFDLCGTTGQSDLRYSWIDYTGGVLKVYLSVSNAKPGSPNMTQELNLKSILLH